MKCGVRTCLPIFCCEPTLPSRGKLCGLHGLNAHGLALAGSRSAHLTVMQCSPASLEFTVVLEPNPYS